MNSPSSCDHAPIMVAYSKLPPLDEYVRYLERIWSNHTLTNNGPLVRELEDKLRLEMGCPSLWFVNNGTTALQLAIKALGLTGDIITTPFSYVATTGVILWESCRPIFVDVRPSDLTIDPDKIEAAITPATSAILATHVYGFPCEVVAIEAIARRRGLKVIYDAAHTFGCRLDGRALASYGDVSCLSFHATKIFHTVEGGAVVVNGPSGVADRIQLMRSFGHYRDDHRHLGINGKNSEFHAAMGLCNLPRFPTHLALHRQQHNLYAELFAGSPLQLPRSAAPNFEYNFAYFPVLLPDESAVERTLASLAALNIHPRRYFFPSLNRISYVQGTACPVAERAAATVLCLPISERITPTLQQTIAAAVVANASS